MKLQHLDAIILAAGRGTRMKATVKNKVVFEVGGKPMISYPISALKELGIERPIVVVGFAQDSVQKVLKNDARYAVQEQALGTADAVRCAEPLVDTSATDVIVLYGDHSTFYTADILAGLVSQHRKHGAAMTLLTTETKDPTGYGRILRDKSGRMKGIIEEKNASEAQKKITEINTGNAVYSIKFLRKYLPKIKKNPLSGEYYFTDIVEHGVDAGERVETYSMKNPLLALGVNDPSQLEAAEEAMRRLHASP